MSFQGLSKNFVGKNFQITSKFNLRIGFERKDELISTFINYGNLVIIFLSLNQLPLHLRNLSELYILKKILQKLTRKVQSNLHNLTSIGKRKNCRIIRCKFLMSNASYDRKRCRIMAVLLY